MKTMSPLELAARLRTGLLSFPVTPFDAALDVDVPRFREHLAWQASYDVAGLFVGGGTGEGFSLTAGEVDCVVRTAVDVIGGRLPVVAPAMGATRNAVAHARAAEAAGASGILLMPPYLVDASQRGLVDHIGAVCGATDLGVVVYSRSNAVLSDLSVSELADRHSNLIGLKDGVGDLEQLTRTVARLGDRLTYIGGLPTAEMFATSLLDLGVSTYSSAVYNFVPEFALHFYDAVTSHERQVVHRLLREFLIPYTELRDRERGYAISIIKAGLTAVGRNAGPVRPPLTDLGDADAAELAALVGRLNGLIPQPSLSADTMTGHE